MTAVTGDLMRAGDLPPEIRGDLPPETIVRVQIEPTNLTVNGFTPELEAECLAAEKETDSDLTFETADEGIAHLHKIYEANT